MPKSAPTSEKLRNRAGSGRRLAIAAAVAIVGACAWVLFRPAVDNAGAEANTRPPKFSVDASPEKQRARRKFMDEMISSGAFDRIDQPVKLPHVYVADAWQLLTVEEKAKAMGVVLAYHYAKDPRADRVIIRDAVTGKRIGMFSEHGLEFD